MAAWPRPLGHRLGTSRGPALAAGGGLTAQRTMPGCLWPAAGERGAVVEGGATAGAGVKQRGGAGYAGGQQSPQHHTAAAAAGVAANEQQALQPACQEGGVLVKGS